MAAGYIKLFRGWQDCPALSDAERKLAWIWLLENACWKPASFNVKGKTVHLERGQICVSVRHLAAAWNWSKSAVDRFLTRLETETMVKREAGHGKLVLTICNYGKYQDGEDADRDSSGTATGTTAGQQRDTKEEREERKKEETKGGYAFDGRVVRLNFADYRRWQTAFPDLDLRAQLTARDDWLSGQDQSVRKRWFQSTSSWLAKRQQETTAAASTDLMADFIC
ncbi:hypothetical protein [Croceicoccus sp. YJ47]|uniref:hypothetical protein n=1 Tax=Croceicoccus sp. YJ47 TaxID=2798724 RepID=UPI001923E320|nr:hypothetical protein [Croceicoccus sp. YJ47]QQN73938.1 hypothetical protein JD971_14505 [Croceicoccus sp. YJ47]